MKKTHIKTYIIVAIFLSIIGISIAYAALSQQLQIKTNASVQSSQTSWNVKITNASCETHNYATIGSTTYNQTTVTVSGVVLKTPLDYIWCNFEVTNAGEVDAKLSNIVQSGPTVTGTGDTKEADEKLFLDHWWSGVFNRNSSNESDRINFDSPGISLEAEEKTTIYFGFGWHDGKNYDHQPTNTLTISNFGYTFNFIQANG